mgnify:CR=1 FL=1
MSLFISNAYAFDDALLPVPPSLLVDGFERFFSVHCFNEVCQLVILNPFATWSILDELEDEFPELFVNNPSLKLYNAIKL